MQKTDEWSNDSDFTNNSEPENNVNGNNVNEDNEDNKSDDYDNVSVLSDDQEDDYFLKLNTEKTVYVITQDNIPLLYVNTIEDVEKAYDSIKYPPIGKRGVGLARAQGYGNNFKDYYNWQKKNIKLVVQIEDVKAVANLDDIFGSKKIDSFFIGPYDLSGSLGIPGNFESPLFCKLSNK